MGITLSYVIEEIGSEKKQEEEEEKEFIVTMYRKNAGEEESLLVKAAVPSSSSIVKGLLGQDASRVMKQRVTREASCIARLMPRIVKGLDTSAEGVPEYIRHLPFLKHVMRGKVR